MDINKTLFTCITNNWELHVQVIQYIIHYALFMSKLIIPDRNSGHQFKKNTFVGNI